MARLVIDAHMHIFPYLGSAGGWQSPTAHVAGIQRLFGVGGSAKSGAQEVDFSAPLPDVNFRIGPFGRFEWTEDGVDYYRQVMPPSLQNQTCSPEFILAQMEHAGVDAAVLQNAKVYGKLNDYFADAVAKYPSRYVGLAEIDELQAHRPEEISRLTEAIKQKGLKGIYYEATRFLEVRRMGGFNDAVYEPFWDEVARLGTVVEWYLSTNSLSLEQYVEHLRLFSVWAERHPSIPSVIVHGLYPVILGRGGQVRHPPELFRILDRPNIYVEILYPITAGRFGWDYPYSETWSLIRQQYEEFGPERLIWGSDMPNLERNCTFRQSLTYLTDYCDFISAADMDLIVGGNAARLFGIDPNQPRQPLGPAKGAAM